MRVVEFGLFGLNVFGMSVKGTSESSCASSGDQLDDMASNPAVAKPICNVSLRVTFSDMFRLHYANLGVEC